MCLYRGIYYHECGHSRFLLSDFCERLLCQLQRINHPRERERYAIPFDGSGCEPRVRLKEDGSVDMMVRSANGRMLCGGSMIWFRFAVAVVIWALSGSRRVGG
jgi:hypothetical protein